MSRWELGLGVVLTLGTVSLLRPHIETTIWRTRRAEADLVLDHLRAHLQAHPRDQVTPFSDVPRGVQHIGSGRRAWPTTGLPAGWVPPTRTARCSYSLTVSDRGVELELRATCDVDGDGQHAIYVTSPSTEIRRLTPNDVY